MVLCSLAESHPQLFTRPTPSSACPGLAVSLGYYSRLGRVHFDRLRVFLLDVRKEVSSLLAAVSPRFIIWLYLLYASPQQPLWFNAVLSGKISKEYIEILLQTHGGSKNYYPFFHQSSKETVQRNYSVNDM